MKANFILILLFLYVTFSAAWAQPKTLPDSIRIELPDQQSFVLFELRDYANDKEVIRKFPVTLGSLLDHVRKSIPTAELSTPHSVHVTSFRKDHYRTERTEVAINERSHTTTLTVKDNAITELLPPGWEVTVQTERHHIVVYAPDFERLASLANVSLEPAITSLDADQQTTVQHRKGLHARMILRNNTIAFSKTGHRLPGDMIGLHAGTGAGIFRDKLYPELNFTTSLYFSNRYKPFHYRVDVRYELKFFTAQNTEGKYLLQPAQFLSGAFAFNPSKGRPRWAALGAGYLIHSRTDLFTGKTMKFFFETDIHSDKLNVVPEFYLTNDFKTFAFGLKLNYKF
jgi:hypothetical protein